MPESKVDQQAIADKLGISRSTVTRVLRHDPSYRIAPETKKKVFDTAKRMGYRLRRRTTSNIAFVVCGEMAAMQSELHMATCEEAAKHGLRVFLVRMPAEPSYRQLSLYVNPLAADGVILTGHTGEDVVEELSNVLPVVMLDCQKPVPVDNVLVDYCHQGRELTRRLLEAGHRRIAVIAQFPEDVSWTGPLEGYKQALEDAGIEPDLSLVWSKAGKLYPLLLKEILAHEARPTAVFALTTSDHAIILSTLMAMDIEVPGDLGYAGWAYSYMAALLPFPAITCLADIYPSMAGTAVRRVLERVEDPGMPAGQFVARVAIKSGETHLKRN